MLNKKFAFLCKRVRLLIAHHSNQHNSLKKVMVSIFKTGLNGHIWRQDPMLFAQQWSHRRKEHRVM